MNKTLKYSLIVGGILAFVYYFVFVRQYEYTMKCTNTQTPPLQKGILFNIIMQSISPCDPRSPN